MGRLPCIEKQLAATHSSLKKGAWTPEEDQKLVSFIEKNRGHGSWRSLPQLAGLQRCGKSCRLRWTNYLRPNIKRGNFSVEEERTITQMHALLGNKWSAIASHLPGRTDNEVKNHWNTHMKKRLTRMGIDPATHRPNLRAAIQPLKMDNAPASPLSLLTQLRYPGTPRHDLHQLLLITEPTHTQSQTSPLGALKPAAAALDSRHPHAAKLQQHRLPNRPATPPQQPGYSSFDVTHMAQWELARLEAEARLASTSSNSSSPSARSRSTDFVSGLLLKPNVLSSSKPNCSTVAGAIRLPASADKCDYTSSSASSSAFMKTDTNMQRLYSNLCKPPTAADDHDKSIFQTLTDLLSVSVSNFVAEADANGDEDPRNILSSLPSFDATSASSAVSDGHCVNSKCDWNNIGPDEYNNTVGNNDLLEGQNVNNCSSAAGRLATLRTSMEPLLHANPLISELGTELHIDMLQAHAPPPLFDILFNSMQNPASPAQPCESAAWTNLLDGLVLGGASSTTLSSCSC